MVPNNINRDNGIEIEIEIEAWMPTIKNTTKGEWYNSRPLRKQPLPRTMDDLKNATFYAPLHYHNNITATIVKQSCTQAYVAKTAGT